MDMTQLESHVWDVLSHHDFTKITHNDLDVGIIDAVTAQHMFPKPEFYICFLMESVVNTIESGRVDMNQNIDDRLFECVMDLLDGLEPRRKTIQNIMESLKISPVYFMKCLPYFKKMGDALCITANISSIDMYFDGIKDWKILKNKYITSERDIKSYGATFLLLWIFHQWGRDKSADFEHTMGHLQSIIHDIKPYVTLKSF